MSDIEHCTLCDAPTGRAGDFEDSIYIGQGRVSFGPLCEECYHDIIAGIIDDEGLVGAHEEISRLGTEVVQLHRQLETAREQERERCMEAIGPPRPIYAMENDESLWSNGFNAGIVEARATIRALSNEPEEQNE